MDTPTINPIISANQTPTQFTPTFTAQETHPAWWRGGIEIGAASAGGSYHPENEDSYLTPLDNTSGLLAVADGVGGGAHGKIASACLIRCIEKLTPALLRKDSRLEQWLHEADDTVAREIAKHTERRGASTFVAAIPGKFGNRWQITWAGDCRAYLLSSHALRQLTIDDTYEHLGETPPAGVAPDDPARMVGSGAVSKANHATVQLGAGNTLLLCSDGIHKYLSSAEISKGLQRPESLNERCRKLVNQAHINGGTDDATIIAIERRRWFGIPGWIWNSALLAAIVGLAWWGFNVYQMPLTKEPPLPATPSATPSATSVTQEKPDTLPPDSGLTLLPDDLSNAQGPATDVSKESAQENRTTNDHSRTPSPVQAKPNHVLESQGTQR